MTTGRADRYFEFFPQELIPAGLQLVFDAWSKVAPASKIGKEDKITGHLTAIMKREKKARKLAFSIHFQVIPLGPTGPVAARIDFKFLAGFDEDAYFAFECKRLRILRGSKIYANSNSYVGKDGMGRFIAGKYAPSQHHSAMLGYVMDGNVQAAKSTILSSINSKRIALKVVSGNQWEKSRFLPNLRDLCQTRHRRTSTRGGQAELTLQHVFLPA